MTPSRYIRRQSPSFIPRVITTELGNTPSTVDELLLRIPRSRRTLNAHLHVMVEAGVIERVANLKNLHKPVYRLKVK